MTALKAIHVKQIQNRISECTREFNRLLSLAESAEERGDTVITYTTRARMNGLTAEIGTLDMILKRGY